MLFNKNFEVVEVFESGLRVTHYLRGTKKAIEKDIEMYKESSKSYQMVGKNAMIVWA